MQEHHNDLPSCVDCRIIVVFVLGRADAIPGEDHRPLRLTRLTEVQWDQLFTSGYNLIAKAYATAIHTRANAYVKWLKINAGDRLQPNGLKLTANVIGCFACAFSPCSA